jgi:hypothetical protein
VRRLQEEDMRRAILVAFMLSGCELTGLTTPSEVNIHLQGTVTAAVGGAPIMRAKVEALKMKLLSDSLAAASYSNTQGHFSISFIQMGSCAESLLKLTATAEGYQTSEYTKKTGTRFIRCTDEVQTINFQLEREPPL